MSQQFKYVIITPVRDEEDYIEATIASVLRQTVAPTEWIVVDDGSQDNTGSIIEKHAASISWIRALHRSNRGFRKSGAGVVEAFYTGYEMLQHGEWEFLVKLDGDLSFDSDYFERCLERFAGDDRLGIGGGGIYHQVGEKLQLETTPCFHVRGATKIYRRACWESIGGLWPDAGWDTIDEVKANMLGWRTRSFADLRVVHHRRTGAADGVLRDKAKHGLACYVSGYHPLFIAAKCLYRLPTKPYVLGSAALLYGFLGGHFKRASRIKDREFIMYLRGQQLRALCGFSSIWK